MDKSGLTSAFNTVSSAVSAHPYIAAAIAIGVTCFVLWPFLKSALDYVPGGGLVKGAAGSAGTAALLTAGGAGLAYVFGPKVGDAIALFKAEEYKSGFSKLFEGITDLMKDDNKPAPAKA